MLIHPELVKLTTSSGTISSNTQKLHGICYEFLVKPASSDTQFDISITDESNIVIYERTSETGTLAESVVLPVHGVYTILISNATKDELFIIKLMIEELQ